MLYTKEKIAHLMDFVEFTNLFATIKRDIYKNLGEKNEPENDAEHTFQLALISWYIVDVYDIKCDKNNIIKFALVHDLVEAYAGDVSAWDTEGRKNKEKAEALAFDKIKNKFTEFSEMIHLIEQYEAQESRESMIVNAIDKMIPVLNIMVDDGRFWKDNVRNLEQLLDIKDHKIRKSQDIDSIWQDIRQHLIENQTHYFS